MSRNRDANALFEVSFKFIIKNDAGQTLLLKMPSGGPMSGYYDLPGGRIKEHEKMAEFPKVFVRELKEELGEKVKIKLSQIPVAVGRHNYPTASKKRGYIFWVFFEGDYKGGKITISEEHEGYDWIDIKTQNIDKYFVQGPWEGMYHYLNKKFPEAKSHSRNQSRRSPESKGQSNS